MIKKQTSTMSIDKTQTKRHRIAIVRTSYHQELTDNLEKHCIATLVKHGVSKHNIKTITVPGSWELPLAVQTVLKSRKVDAVVVFGVIVKGETYHFDMIANEVARSLMQLSLDYSTPVALEVLAVYDLKQAQARAGDDEYNKGIEGAKAVLQMIATV